MTAQPGIRVGRIVLNPIRRTAARLQIGGRRPPPGSHITQRIPVHTRRRRALSEWLRWRAAIAAGATALATSLALAQPVPKNVPNLAGTYRCDGEEAACDRSGWTFTVSQSGGDLEIKNEKGDFGSAKLTSAISLSAGPPWNMLGVIMPDDRTIEWSNGTMWRKQ